MFSLAGLPPTAGFIGKLGVFTAALRGGETTLAMIGIISSIISLFFYLRIIALLYDKKAATDPT
jgi:NADH-quinone oxidoreductase subunit N